MRRVFITVHLKNFILLSVAFISFIVIASVLIVGVGDNKSLNKSEKYKIKSEEYKNIIKSSSIPKNYKIKVFISKENTIKEIDLEEYITGVVASEMPAEFELEALKAQAVASRTYALAHVTELGGILCKNANGANLCDTVHCQAYMNKEDRIKLWVKDGRKYWDKIETAVKCTQGQVLTYNNSLVMEPYYFATSSGKTENSEEVFSNKIPYLRSVKSGGEEGAPKFKSSKIFGYNELSQIINNNYSNAKLTSASIKKQIVIIDRTKAGSVKNIKTGNVTMTGSKFRTMLGLNSSNFEIVFNLKGVEIDCTGYGHGVGMSQWGADAMAKEGNNYTQILNHYYIGTVISK
ncbi:stage II sporulation protein D [Clostridium sp. FP2]|uniref:stage II sporulation protein D n=1 Tax=Clostridium sp. FP2 TaxID=2724481 RepID=UPI0013E93DF5|nr:stage II sporulation protein D [Clostridium sp. FP2]MBZ9621642.1 stage II sporulation protein D [Clostridium sp. FP2]